MGGEACSIAYFVGQWVKRTGIRNMTEFQHVKCKKINGKRSQIAEISHSVRKSESGNRTVVSQLTPHAQ